MEVARSAGYLFMTATVPANLKSIRTADLNLMSSMYCAELEFLSSPVVAKNLGAAPAPNQHKYILDSVIGTAIQLGPVRADELSAYRSRLVAMGYLVYDVEPTVPTQDSCDAVARRYLSLKR